MANYYTEASFMVHFETKEKEARAAEILHSLENHEEEPCQGPLKKLAKDMEMQDFGYVGFNFTKELFPEAKVFTWWVTHDETIDVDRTATFLSYLIDHDLLKPMGFQFSHTCSKARLDAFGGGCVFITRDATYWSYTGSVLQDYMEEFGEDDES